MNITVGIELNGVIRNINKQILKYYIKDIDMSLDIDEIDDKDDPFKYAKFDSRKERNEFVYADYPYEIFGCAKTMEKDLAPYMTKWLYELTNYEDNNVELKFFSMDEEALTIQSSFFFLSKIGTRVREVTFPTDYESIREKYDVIITANPSTLEYFKGKGV